MKLLLDTHVMLWWAAGDRRLSKATRELIASTANEVAVSAASFWEVAIKISLGRIEVDLEALATSLEADGFDELPVRAAHTIHLPTLTAIHNDPFDRLLIAQSISEQYRLLTRDEAILRYRDVPGFDPIEA